MPEAVAYLTGIPEEELVGEWERLGLYSRLEGTDWGRFVQWAEDQRMEHVPLELPLTLDELSRYAARRNATFIATTPGHAFVALRGLLVDNGGLRPEEIVLDLVRVPRPRLPRSPGSRKLLQSWREVVEADTKQDMPLKQRSCASLLKLSRRSSRNLETYAVLTSRQILELKNGIVQGYVPSCPQDPVISYFTLQ